jgi:ABC-type nitrate/sulfonate/bicarbonate transport system substrate-binding protein
MEVVRRKKVSKASRRDVLKGAAALGATGLGFGFNVRRARAAGIKVSVVNSSGNFSRVQLVLLEKLKLFEKYGIDAELLNVSDTNKILAGLIGGDGDICAGAGYTGLFPAIEKGATIKILAGASVAPLNILYSNKPDIKSVKDLPGRTVGTGALGSLLHEQAVADMKKYGVDYHKVSFVNVGSSNDVFKALVGGSIDAGVAPIDFRDTAGQYGLHPLVDGEFWKELPLYVNQAMFATDKTIAEKRKGLVGTMAAYGEMFRWIVNKANRPAWMQVYAETFPKASPGEAEFLVDFLSQPRGLATDLVLTPEQINYVQELNVELSVQSAVLPFNKCADMSLAQEAVKLMSA